MRGWRPTAKGELVTGIVESVGNGAAVIWLTGMIGDGIVGVGGSEGNEVLALPGMIQSSGLKVEVFDD